MSDSRLRTLIYHIVGQPEDWLKTSVEEVHSLADSGESLDADENHFDIKMGHQILEKLKQKQSVLEVITSFLEDSRFGITIANHAREVIYSNSKAAFAATQIHDSNKVLKPSIQSSINKLRAATNSQSRLVKIELCPSNSDTGKNSVSVASNGYITFVNAENTDDYLGQLIVIFTPNFDTEVVKMNEDLMELYEISKKEERVLACLVNGLNNRQIAESLNISVNTVKTHKSSIFSKTNTNSQVNLTTLFLNHELSQIENYFDFKSNGQSLSNQGNPSRFITLKTGTKLCYKAYGPESGEPIVLLHRAYACRLNVQHDHEAILEKHNKRLYIYDRPGYGKSEDLDAYPENHSDILNDFADQLNLEQFSLIGNLNSAALALDYAVAFPDRLNNLSLIAPVYVKTRKQCKLLGEVLFAASRLAFASNKVASEIYRLWLRSISTDSDKKFKHVFASSLGKQEAHLLDDSRYAETAIANFDEAFKNQTSGSAKDLIYSITPRDLDLSKISSKVNIWLGGDDRMVSPELIDEVYSNVKDKHLYCPQGYGSDLTISMFDEILAKM